jgi:hypothetical protein
MWGFILMAKGNKIEFYHPDQTVADNWINALKEFVVLIDLKEDYHID